MQKSKMSNSLTQLVPVFNGTNYMTWGLAMKNYLLAQGQWRNTIIKPFPKKIYPQKEVLVKDPKGGEDIVTLVDDLSQHHLNYDDIEKWIENNDKARGNIMLWRHNVIAEKFYGEEHASSIWEALEKEYGKPGIAAIYQEFTGAMTTNIPDNSDPSFALEKIISHFTRMATSKCVLPEHLKAMILISKMPPSMTALIQLVCQTDDVNELNCDKIKKMIIHGWEQKLSNRSARPQQPQAAKKISAIQRSGPPPHRSNNLNNNLNKRNMDKVTKILNEVVGEEDEGAEEEPSEGHVLARINRTSNNRPQDLLKNVLHLPPLLSFLAKSPLPSLFLTSLVRSTRTSPTPSPWPIVLASNPPLRQSKD